MAKGDAQTNRWLGDCTVALYAGRKPDRLPDVPFSVHPRSQNHLNEAVAVALAAGVKGAREQAAGRLKWQRDRGHCQAARKSELLCDSHAPIDLRAHALGTWAAKESGAEDVFALYCQWWAREFTAESWLLVPEGPRAGSIVGLGGRYQDGWDDTRDVVYAVAHGNPHGKSKGYFERARQVPDLIAALIVRDLAAEGVFDNLKPEPPTLPFPYVVTRFANGHLCETPEGGLQDGDPTRCWVRYDDGKIGTGEDVPDLGHELAKYRIEATAGDLGQDDD